MIIETITTIRPYQHLGEFIPSYIGPSDTDRVLEEIGPIIDKLGVSGMLYLLQNEPAIVGNSPSKVYENALAVELALPMTLTDDSGEADSAIEIQPEKSVRDFLAARLQKSEDLYTLKGNDLNARNNTSQTRNDLTRSFHDYLEDFDKGDYSSTIAYLESQRTRVLLSISAFSRKMFTHHHDILTGRDGKIAVAKDTLKYTQIYTTLGQFITKLKTHYLNL